jgi:hypothetical protein
MHGRESLAYARDHAQRDAWAQAGADDPFAAAGRLDDLAGQPDGYLHQISAERAARVTHHTGEPLARDARQAARTPRLQGTGSGTETDLLARTFPESEDAGRFPLPRVLETSPASVAPAAATLPDGTPHADPFLAGRSCRASGGLHVRQSRAQPEAG